jgi:hypothetical protein
VPRNAREEPGTSPPPPRTAWYFLADIGEEGLVTDLFAAAARLDAGAVMDAIPPSVRRDLAPAPTPRRDGDDVLLELGPWVPRTPARHLLPSFALLTPRPPSVRFELSARREGAWSAWVATMTLGGHAFSPLPSSVGGLEADIDEVQAVPSLEAVRLRVRVGGSDDDVMFEAPWLVTLSTWDGDLAEVSGPPAAVSLAVPARTQMTAPEAVRLRICSPTSVGMALDYLGCAVPTLDLAAEIFHAPTDRYGVWPAAVRAAAAHGLPGYLLRFPDWHAVAWCLGRGLPIVASVRYARGELTHAAMPDTTGHLIVITGLDGDDVLVNDPAAATEAEVARRYRRDELTRAWLERTGVGYVFMPRV